MYCTATFLHGWSSHSRHSGYVNDFGELQVNVDSIREKLDHTHYVHYRVTLVVPPPCPVDQPILQNSHLPKQNQAGMTKIIVNPTQVRDHQSHPVLKVFTLQHTL